MTQRELQQLSTDECFALLRQARVGRLVYLDDLGPVAVPVNYAMAGLEIVFRVEGGSKQLAMQQQTLTFEADHIDEEDGVGWSVIVRGVGHEVERDELPGLVRQMGEEFPRPWAAGVHNVWLRITPRTVTGRRLGDRYVAPAI